MQLTYQKLGKDHPFFDKVDYLVADGTTPICYKIREGYLPLESDVSSVTVECTELAVEIKPLYVLSFKVNGETEEMTFFSKKKLEKQKEFLSEKAFITDFKTTVYKVVE